jgi:hypothetical protein
MAKKRLSKQAGRQLTPSQLGLVAAKARAYYDADAAKRKAELGGRPSKNKLPVMLPGVVTSDARDAAGKAVGVSGSLVDRARPQNRVR